MGIESDINLHFVEKGVGVPLILLHGNGEDLSYFENQIAYFSAVYRVIAIDTRGHGATPRGTAPFTIRQFADDLFHFMLAHTIDSAHILGFSDGGNVALAFAMKYPNRVKRLVLNGANLFPAGLKTPIQQQVEAAYSCYLQRAKTDERAKQKLEMLGLMVLEPDFNPLDLRKIQAPTLVLVGDDDMIDFSHTQLIHKHIVNSQLQVIEGDHFIAKTNPQAFNLAVEQFLSK